MDYRKSLLISVAALAVGLPNLALAQDENGEADIVVTANKREQNLNDVGMTITAVGSEALQNRRIASLEDVASLAPGLVFTPSANNTPILTLRGVGFNEKSIGVYPAVSVYIDQIPLPFPVLALHSAYDLERIEVLKGPQGTIFGQNSTGGAINYIAARPTDTLQAGGDISYGRFNAIEGNAFISGPLSDRAGFRVALNGRNADGWQKSYTRNGRNGKESYIAGRLTLDVEPTDTLKLSFVANGWRDRSEPQAQQLVAIHEQIGQGGSKDLDAAPLEDALRNAYLPAPAGCPSAQFCYPFPTKYTARTADWSTRFLDPGSVGANADGTSDPADASYSDFTPRGNRRFYQFALRGDLEIGGMTLSSLTSYADYKQRQMTDQDGMNLPSYDLSFGGFIKTFNQELRLQNDAASRLRWMLGANYEHSKTSEAFTMSYWGITNFSAGNLYINDSRGLLRQNIHNWAVFGSTEFDITDALTFKASARYTDSKIGAFNCGTTSQYGNVDKLFNVLGGMSGLPFTPIGPSGCYPLNSISIAIPKDVMVHSPLSTGGALGLGVPGVPFEATMHQDNVSWRVGLDYKASRDLMLYANVSRGFKAGSFPAGTAAAFSASLPVTQEKVTAYEAGVKAGLADGTVQLNAAGFYMDYRDKQVRGRLFDFIFGTLDTLVNVPKSRIYGFETELTVRPVRGLTMAGALTYLNTKIQRYVGYDVFGGLDNDIDSRPGNFDPTGATPNVEDLSGVRIPYTPKWAGSLNIDYRHELSNGGAPFVGVTVRAQSNQTAAIGGEDTTLPVAPGRRFRIAPGVNPYLYMIDGYATVDARIGYEAPDGQWRVMLWGKNIFDKYYWTAVNPASDSEARFAGRPATYGVTLGLKFR